LLQSPTSRRPDPTDAAGMTRAQHEQLLLIPTAARDAQTRHRTIIRFTSGQQVLGRETEQLFGLGNQAGQEPEKRTMAVFCGFGG